MKLHRFIGNFDLKAGDLKLEDAGLFNQFHNVLKLRAGEKLVICDGHGNEGVAEIKEYGKGFVMVEIGKVMPNQNEPERSVILYSAILKKENFELVVQKATEIGIKEIVPIITERTVKLDIRKDRLEKIIREAAEQSGRGIVPVLHDPVDFDEAVNRAKQNGANFFLDSSGDGFENLKLSAQGGSASGGENYPLGVWVGPEGGWTSDELEMAKNKDFKIISLGKTTLRAETAAIVGSYLAIHSPDSSQSL